MNGKDKALIASERAACARDVRKSAPRPDVSIMTGGFDPHYALGLTMALAEEGLRLDVIGSDETDSPAMHSTPNVDYWNLQGSKPPGASLMERAMRTLRLYARILRYVVTDSAGIVHILWNNKFEYFDRTLLSLFYKLLGKKLVLTAHNVNAAKRDEMDSMLNRATLKVQYLLADHIFVHTEKSRCELMTEFGVDSEKVSVIPYGINDAVPNTELTSAEARRRLGIGEREKVILFFGAVRPYKGLEYLADAFALLAQKHAEYRLIIAGEPKRGTEAYVQTIQRKLGALSSARTIQRFAFIPDEETELYFKAADVSVLPYKQIFQSGVLFLSYSFGLPVIASDVGSFKEDIIEGELGFVCRTCDAGALAAAIERYFESELYLSLESRRKQIQGYAAQRNSWKVAGERISQVYLQLLEGHTK